MYIYTQCNLFIGKNKNKIFWGLGSSIFMQGVRPVKNKKYKLVLVLMEGRSHTVQTFSGRSVYGLYQWKRFIIINWSPVKVSKSDDTSTHWV